MALEGLDPPTFGQTFFSGQFDLGYIGFGQDYHHPENWLLLWTETGALNAGGYANPAFTASVEAALAEDDFDEAVVLWQRAEEILIDQPRRLTVEERAERDVLVDEDLLSTLPQHNCRVEIIPKTGFFSGPRPVL